MRQIPGKDGYNRLKELGHADWRRIPQERLVRMVKTEPQWQNEIRWARNELRKNGFLDSAAGRGVWRLTAAGLREAGRQPEDLAPAERQIATPRRRRPARPITQPIPIEPGVDKRKLLQVQLLNISHSMPLEDLELLVEIATTIRRRSLPVDERG
jgi:restriction endonuclease Mrr